MSGSSEQTESSEQTQSSSVEIALRALDNAIDLFDEIFYEIAPVHAYNEPNKGEGVLIPFRSLTDKQCHVVKELSGHLVSARKSLVGRRPSEVQSPARSPSSVTASISNTFMEQKMGMLRDYLMHELARSESAELQLKAKEDDLVLITVECEKLKKKIATMTAAAANQANQIKNEQHGSSHTTHSNSRAASVDRIDTQPESYVYSYVRKQFADSYFFGVIAQYDAKEQFFQIVYEDADYEDITHSELRRIMWPNSTPSAKREACLKHAKLLGMITPEQYATLHAELKSGGKNGSSNHNNSSSNNNGNSSNGSSSNGSGNGNSSNGSGRGTSSNAPPRQPTVFPMRRSGCITIPSFADSISVEDSPTTTKGDDEVPLGNSGQTSTGTTNVNTSVPSIRSSLSSLHLLNALSSNNNNNSTLHTDNNGSRETATTSSTSSLQKLQQLVARTAPTIIATNGATTGLHPVSSAINSSSAANTTSTVASATNAASVPSVGGINNTIAGSAPAPANPLRGVSGSNKVPPPAKSQQLKGNNHSNSKQKAIPQHALINAHFVPTSVATTTALATTVSNKHTSINDIVAASGITAAASTTTTAPGVAKGYANTSPQATAHSVSSSVRTNSSVSAASQRGEEEGVTFLHSTTPTQVSTNKAVTGGSGGGSSAVRSVATGKGQPSFGSATKPSPTTTAASAIPATHSSTHNAVPRSTNATQQPSKRKAEDKADGKNGNAVLSTQETSSHKKMRSNSDDMAIIPAPVKVIEIIEID